MVRYVIKTKKYIYIFVPTDKIVLIKCISYIKSPSILKNASKPHAL